MDNRQKMQALFEEIAEELEKAAAHARTGADHFSAGEVPRGCAHGASVMGHVHAAQERLSAWLRFHAAHSRP